jgi:hypothetical protein
LYPTVNSPQSLSPHERVSRAMNAMEQPHVCDKCGSTHFTAVSYFQYAVGHYSSAPGGDLHQIGEMPQTILVCICGEPKTPNIGGVRGGRTASGEIKGFLDSLKGAQAYRARLAEDVHAVVEASGAISTGDLVLQTEFNELRQRFEAALAKLESAPPAPSALAGAEIDMTVAEFPAKPVAKGKK